jgi:hypothetical protein
MLAKIKSSVFIDTLQLQFKSPAGESVRGILIDDRGYVCRTIERDTLSERGELTWTGLNDLPYGQYTLEISRGNDAIRMKLVKRI